MIELVHNPTGEVQLASITAPSTAFREEKEMTSDMHCDNDAHSDNDKTIAELKETIQSLQSQIEVRLVYTVLQSLRDVVAILLLQLLLLGS